MKVCSCCKRDLDPTMFSFNRGKLQTFCKECQKEYSKRYRQENKEKCRQNLKDWRAKNKE